MTEDNNMSHRSNKLDSMGSGLQTGPSIQIKKNLTIEPRQEQEPNPTKFPQIRGSKNS